MGLIKKVRYCKEIDQDVIEISPQTEERIKILNAVINNEWMNEWISERLKMQNFENSLIL